MKSRLDQIEHRLQSFFENSLFIFPWNNHQTLFSHLLVDAIQRTLNQDAYGNFTPGRVFSISANSEIILPWQSDPTFLPTLSKILFDAAADAGLSFSSLPEFKLIADPSIPAGRLRIEPFETNVSVEETGVMSIQSEDPKDPENKTAINPFLIVNGNQVYPLRLGVINLGRRSDNQIVIDDPAVSRSHAQLRAMRGQYILCDLNSTGGTFVNGERITQCILRPGDVISLAGISIIYGEETSPDSRFTNGDTSEIPLNSPKP